MNPADRLIVALDLPTNHAYALVYQLRGAASFYKLGVDAFLSYDGVKLAHYIKREGYRLFIDIKLYDTADTIKRTMDAVAELGADMVTVHASCARAALNNKVPIVLAVDQLTDSATAAEGHGFTPNAIFEALNESKRIGVVCAAAQIPNLRRLFPDAITVCPGIRPLGSPPNNHKRPATAEDAIKAGADYIVVGRPIYLADDPVEATRAIIREIEAAQTTAC